MRRFSEMDMRMWVEGDAGRKIYSVLYLLTYALRISSAAPLDAPRRSGPPTQRAKAAASSHNVSVSSRISALNTLADALGDRPFNCNSVSERLKAALLSGITAIWPSAS